MRMSAVLTVENAGELAKERYGLRANAVRKLSGGNTAHLLMIETDIGGFALKESSPAFSLEDVVLEARVTDHLECLGVPAAPFSGVAGGSQSCCAGWNRMSANCPKRYERYEYA